MKKLFFIAFLLSSSIYCEAQEGNLAFPFQGGSPIMTRFFKDSLQVGTDVVNKKATGTAVIKFTADLSGNISRIVIYYADDYILAVPIIEALKKSTKKWIIPNKEKYHDFILPFSIAYLYPSSGQAEVQKAAYEFYVQRRPIISKDQIPLNSATLLPTVIVEYKL